MALDAATLLALIIVSNAFLFFMILTHIQFKFYTFAEIMILIDVAVHKHIFVENKI